MPVHQFSESTIADIRDNLQDFGDHVANTPIVAHECQKEAFTVTIADIYSVIDTWLEDHMKAFVVIDAETRAMSRLVVYAKTNEKLFDLVFDPAKFEQVSM